MKQFATFNIGRRGERFRYWSGHSQPMYLGVDVAIGDLVVFGDHLRGTYTVICIERDGAVLLDRPLETTIVADRGDVIERVKVIGQYESNVWFPPNTTLTSRPLTNVDLVCGVAYLDKDLLAIMMS